MKVKDLIAELRKYGEEIDIEIYAYKVDKSFWISHVYICEKNMCEESIPTLIIEGS